MSTTATEPVLQVRGIDKNYGGVHALDDVSLSLLPGTIHCLAGENGSGKSTLIKIISGVERPDAGDIVIAGVAHKAMTPSSAIAAGIQVIYQDFSLFGNLTVAENIALLGEVAARRRIYSARRTRPLAEQIANELNLRLDMDAEVDSLSVADKQLTAICRALVGDARIIIMDEPTTALTAAEVERLFAVVRHLQARGVAMVFVSHKLDEVLEVADELTILRNGSVVASGPAKQFDRAAIEVAMTGRRIDESRLISPLQADAPVVLAVENLNREGFFSDISFSLRRGEILGLTGLLGSGRSEIAESIFGVLPADSGTITVDGELRHIKSIKDAVKAGIGYVPPDRLTQGLFLEKSIVDNIIAASLRLYRSGVGLLDNKRIKTTIDRLFTRLRVKAPSVAAPVRSLSGGNAQRVVLAKWLALSPRVLMLNGPTVGVDVGSKEEILALLREQAAAGMGLIVISDDMPELVTVCDRVLVVRQGRITAELVGDDITIGRIQKEVAA